MRSETRWRIAGILLMLTGAALAFAASIAAFMHAGKPALVLGISAGASMLLGGYATRRAMRPDPTLRIDPADRRRVLRLTFWALLMVVGLPALVVGGLGLALDSGAASADASLPLGSGIHLHTADASKVSTTRALTGTTALVVLDTGEAAVRITLDETSRASLATLSGGPWWLTKDGEAIAQLESLEWLTSSDGAVIAPGTYVEAESLRARLGTVTAR